MFSPLLTQDPSVKYLPDFDYAYDDYPEEKPEKGTGRIEIEIRVQTDSDG